MNRTKIIAEIGVNHNGDIETAKKMIEVAKECGADVAKFQTAKIDSIVSKHAGMADYQKDNIGQVMSQKDMLKDLLLPFDAYYELSYYCKKVGIEFLSTPFDIDSIQLLNSIQSIWKIPSGEITNYPYLREIAKTGKDIILSTGMSTFDEINDAITVLDKYKAGKVSLLHCTTDYPTPMNDVNLNAMIAMKDRFRLPVGYSDHTKGIEVSIAAVAIGATIIEKHFTLDRNMLGPDHKASLEPNELKDMIKSIRNIEIAMGDYEKRPSDAEMKNRKVARKSIVASRKIKIGEILGENNLTTKRPGNGISPMKWNEIIGTRAIRDFDEDDLIEI